MTICFMQVDDEAIAAMDDDAAAHWKRYVGESSSMDRGMLERVLRFVCAHLNPFFLSCAGAFGRYALDIVSLYVEPERKPGQLPKYSPGMCVCDEASRSFGTVNMLTSPC